MTRHGCVSQEFLAMYRHPPSRWDSRAQLTMLHQIESGSSLSRARAVFGLSLIHI